MEKQLRKYETYARGVKNLMLVSGLWPGRVSTKLFRLVIVFHSTLSIFTLFGVIYFVVGHITNLDLFTKAIGNAVSFCLMLLKVMVFTRYRPSLVKLHATLEMTFQQDLENPEYQSVLLSSVTFFYQPTLFLTVSSLVLSTLYNLIPIISIVIQLSHGNEIIKRRTPFPGEYPFPESNSFYATRYLIHVGSSYAIGMITAATDALFGFYIFQITSQIRVLAYRIRNLTTVDDYQRIIRECLIRRETLVECLKKLQDIYGPIVLWMLVTSALAMCTHIYQASHMSMDKAFLIFFYITMKLLQTMLYAWFGLCLTTESEDFRDAVYSCGWPGCGDKIFLSNIKILLLCRSLVVKACQCYVISLEMFIGIMNATLSYYFLLRTLEEK